MKKEFVLTQKSYFYRKLIRPIKHFYQKLTQGFSDKDTWSLDYTICKLTLPRLKRFREICNDYYPGVPATLAEQFPNDDKVHDEWINILDKIIYAMEKHIDDEYLWIGNKDERKKIEEGFKLFHEYFFALWW